MTLRSRFKELPLQASELYDLPVSIIGDPNIIKPGSTPVTITVYSKDGQYSASAQDVFIYEPKIQAAQITNLNNQAWFSPKWV